METTTPFDLNHAIQQWRADLAQSSAFRGENLDELETHLRDSVTSLQARDLSAEEAFYIAAKRVGNGAVLVKEFGKVNGVNIWVERFLWALIAMQTWTVIQTILRAMGTFLQGKNGTLTNLHSGWAAVDSILLFYIIPLGMAILIFWRLFKSPKSKVGSFLENLSIRPAAIAWLFFLLGAGADLFYAFTINYNYKVSNYVQSSLLMMFFSYLPGNIVYSRLIFILARRRLLRKA